MAKPLFRGSDMQDMGDGGLRGEHGGTDEDGAYEHGTEGRYERIAERREVEREHGKSPWTIRLADDRRDAKSFAESVPTGRTGDFAAVANGDREYRPTTMPMIEPISPTFGRYRGVSPGSSPMTAHWRIAAARLSCADAT
jgi:hypothetical protein